MKQILPTLYLVFCAFAMNGQNATLSGKVTDSKTKDPLPGVFILAEDKKGAATDANGNYRLVLSPGKHNLTIKFLSYDTKKTNINLDAGENKVMNFELEESSNVLNVVVITSSQYQKNLTQETVSMDVLSKDLIKNTNITQLGDAVQKSPGVLVQDGQISIRGGSSYSYGVGSRTAVLVDNMNFVSGDLGDAQLKFAPIEATEQVEVIKGASSVVYGSSALNGVVNLRTSWGTETPQYEVSTFATLYGDPKRKLLKWWGKEQPFETGISGIYRQKKGPSNFVVGGNFYKLNSHLVSANEIRGRTFFKTKFNPGKVAGLSLGIDGNIMYENSDRFFLSPDLDSNQYKPASSSGDRYLRTSIDPHLSWVLPKNNKFQFNSRFLNVYRFGNGADIDASSWVYSFDIQHQKWITFKNESNLVITAGLPFTVTTNKSNLYSSFGSLVTAIAAGYLQMEYKWKRLSVVAGGRYEIQKITDKLEKSLPIFRAGINYNLGKATFLRASWGQGYRMPSLAERYVAASLVAGTFVIPNRDLKPEQSWSLEIGIKQGFKITNNWKGLIDFSMFTQQYKSLVEYNIGFFENKYTDGTKIFPDQGDYVLGFKPYNVNDARIGGYEVSLMGQGKIKDFELNTLVGYTYNYPGNAGSISPNRTWGNFIKNAVTTAFKRLSEPEVTFITPTGSTNYSILQYRTRHMFRGDIEGKYKGFSLGYSLYYNSFPEVVQATFKVVFNTLDGGKNTLDTFIKRHERGDWVMDIRAAYQINKNFDMSLIVKNFTNREYAWRIGKADAPINFTLKMRYRF